MPETLAQTGLSMDQVQQLVDETLRATQHHRVLGDGRHAAAATAWRRSRR